MENTTSLNQRLKELRQKKGLSQNDVADQLNLSRQAISRWETGKTCPDIESLYLLSKIYGVTLEVLIGKEIEENRVSNDPGEKNIDKNIKQNNIIIEIEELLLSVIDILSCSIPILGFLIPIGILFWMKHRKRRYIFIIILSFLCIFGGLYTTYSFLYILSIQSENIQIIQI